MRHSISNRCSEVHDPVNNFSLSEYLFLSKYYISHAQHNINILPQNNFIKTYRITQVKPDTGSQIYFYDATASNLHQCCKKQPVALPKVHFGGYAPQVTSCNQFEYHKRPCTHFGISFVSISCSVLSLHSILSELNHHPTKRCRTLQ